MAGLLSGNRLKKIVILGKETGVSVRVSQKIKFS
jgi:hypothetical protein